jgi:hypothetical protein
VRDGVGGKEGRRKVVRVSCFAAVRAEHKRAYQAMSGLSLHSKARPKKMKQLTEAP